MTKNSINQAFFFQAGMAGKRRKLSKIIMASGGEKSASKNFEKEKHLENRI